MELKSEEDMLTMSAGDVLEYISTMKSKYLSMHKAPITQGTGKDKRWTTRVPDPTKADGRRIIRKPTREEVENEVIRFYMEQEGRRPKVSTSISVNAYFQWWIEYKKHNRTLKSETFRKYRNDYKRFFENSAFGQLPVTIIDFIDIEDFLREQTEHFNLKRKAVTTLASYVRGLFNLAIRDRLISENPFARVDLRNNVYCCCNRSEKTDAERILSTQEMKALRDVVQNHLQNNPLYMSDWAIEICMWTGLRVGEVVALKWSDLMDGELVITKSERRIIHEDGHPDTYEIGDTKNHKDRRVPVGKELMKVLMRLRQVQSDNGIEGEYILTGLKGREIAPTITKAIYRRGLEAGIGTCSIHRIRRTVSSRLNQFYDRATVSHIMGHTEQVKQNHYDYDMEEIQRKKDTMDQLYAG